jgi:hypothetical protein
MKLTLTSVKDRLRKLVSNQPDSRLDPETVKQMARGIATAQLDEIGCDECFAQMDQFVDMVLEGKNAAEAMPLVQDHLDRCGDCREEFEALLVAVQLLG